MDVTLQKSNFTYFCTAIDDSSRKIDMVNKFNEWP